MVISTEIILIYLKNYQHVFDNHYEKIIFFLLVHNIIVNFTNFLNMFCNSVCSLVRWVIPGLIGSFWEAR